MKKQKSLKLNFVMNTLHTMSSFIFPLITFPYASRVLLPEGTGKVAFATSLISYFTMFAQLGIPTYGMKLCAKVRDNREQLTRTAHELLFINLVMSVISYIALAAALLFIPRLHEDRTLYVVVSLNIILTSIGMEWLYKALEQYTYITVRSLVFKLVALVAMFLLVHQQEDYVIYGGITILAACASNIFNLVNVHRYIDFRWVGHYNIRRHFRPVAIFFAMACATTIYTHMDVLMLGAMAPNKREGDMNVGYYNAAVRIKTILVSIVTSLGPVMLPRAANFIKKKKYTQFWRVSRKALNFVILLATPLMLYFMLYARYGVRLLSGIAYEPAVLPMIVIMPTLVLIGITNVLGIQIMLPLDRHVDVLRSELVGLAVNLIVNALLIPRLASVGAAIGTVAAEAAVLIVQYLTLRRELSDAFRVIQYDKIALALVAGTLCSDWVPLLQLHHFWTLAVTSCLFFGAYLGVLLLTRETLTVDLTRQTINKINKMKKSARKFVANRKG